MPVNGFKFHEQETLATSDQMIEKQKRYYLECIESLSHPDVCLKVIFQLISNYFLSCLMEFFKKISENFSEDEKNSMFYDCAKKLTQSDVY